LNFDQFIAKGLAERHQQNRYRRRQTVEGSQGARISINGREFIGFCSNDYLGLAGHPKVVEALQQAALKYGVGSGASHLVCGHNSEHHALEVELAEFTRRDRALLFSTGYMANLGSINALLGHKDIIFEDRLNHASLLDAAQLCGAELKRFRHNDMSHLQQQLEGSSATRKLIVVDGVFSMDGDLAPLPELTKLANQYDAWLMVDDAHGFGVLGEMGAGCLDYFKLTQQDVPILMGTLGKALGTFGAFIAGKADLIEYLIQFARPYIYTTALPPTIAAATRAALKIIQAEPERRHYLWQLIEYFRIGAGSINLSLLPSQSAVQALIVKDDLMALTLAEQLKNLGFLVSAIRPPTVPEGTARLRITLSANHTLADIDALLAALEGCLHLNDK
jgi:8-amino-7-oxononanoate synthase